MAKWAENWARLATEICQSQPEYRHRPASYPCTGWPGPEWGYKRWWPLSLWVHERLHWPTHPVQGILLLLL